MGRLRSIYRGLDPQIGFFGMLGRRHQGRTAAEGIVENYRKEDSDLDVGYWDFTGSAPTPRDHLQTLARLITDMGLGAWCLEGIRADEVADLVLHLAEGYRLDYEIAASPSEARPGLAVIYRRSRVASVKRLPWDAPGAGLASPVRLVFRLRGRAGKVRGLGLVPLSSEIVPEVVQQLAEALTCEADQDGQPHDWLVIGRKSPAFGLGPGPMRPADCPLPGGCVQARVIADGHDGAFVLLSGQRSCVRQVYLSPNLVPIDPDPQLVIVTTDRALPMLPGVWQDPFALRLALKESDDEPKAVPSCPRADPNSRAVPQPATPEAPADLTSLQARLEQILGELLRPVLSRVIGEALRGAVKRSETSS
jgi:hypothetical protein